MQGRTRSGDASVTAVRFVAAGVAILAFFLSLGLLMLLGFAIYASSKPHADSDLGPLLLWTFVAVALLLLVACVAASWGLWHRRTWARALAQLLGVLIVWEWLVELPRPGGQGGGGIMLPLVMAAIAAVAFLEMPAARAVFGLPAQGVASRPMVAVALACAFVMTLAFAWTR